MHLNSMLQRKVNLFIRNMDLKFTANLLTAVSLNKTNSQNNMLRPEKMKKIFSAFLVFIFYHYSPAQVSDWLGVDNNPMLSKNEIAFMDNLFINENYDFNSKTIGFAY